jgi:hypothetical protein
MRRTATTLLLLLTTLWASAQIKQTYLPDFKKGQTATYEYICTKTHRRNCDNVTVDGLELNSPFVPLGGAFSLMYLSGMIPTGDSISNKFSLKVLEATPYAYIMELRILDVGLPHVITKEEGAQKFLDVIGLVKSLKLRLMMSKRLGEWKVINADELYRQVINEGRRRKLSVFEGEDKQSDEEIIEDMRKANAIEGFISLFVPGINAFTDAYQLRCENGHREEGKLEEKKDSFKFVSDVTKGKGRAINLKMNSETYSSVYEPYVDIDTTDVDTVEIDTVVADSVITEYEDSLPSIEDRGVLCKVQNIIDVKMDKNTWLEKYENTVIINYPNSVGTIYKVVRRRDD